MRKLAEPVTRIAVEVTFLRMDHRPMGPIPPLPYGMTVEKVLPRCGIAEYRRLYVTVGQDYVWWLRRTLSDRALDAVLADSAISVHVLRDAEGDVGFYELDRRAWPAINIAYFGLFPRAVGQRAGMGFLFHAVTTAWAEGPVAVKVNTCNADHPRALPNYIKAGFTTLRTIREEWPVPDRLGLPIPARLLLGPHQ